jgi:N-acetylmuramoyl-L-alanine amidase
MNIVQNLLTINRQSRPGLKLKSIKGVCIHWTANPKASAIANRNYFENLKKQTSTYASAHYIIGLNGEIIQCIPDNEVAYHAGSKTYTSECKTRLYGKPNYYLIGIELCPIDIQGRFNTTTLISCIELVRELLKKYKLTVNDIWTHKEVVGWKDCPRWFVNNPNDWQKFKIAVQGYEVILNNCNLTTPQAWIDFVKTNKTGILQYLPALIEKVYAFGITNSSTMTNWQDIIKKCTSNPNDWIAEIPKHKWFPELIIKIFNS